jgi:hypothetical protein
MDLERKLRDGLREAGSEARFDEGRWSRSAARRPTGLRVRRSPALRPVRRWAAAATVAAVLIAGIGIPLTLLSPLSGDDQAGPRSSARNVEGYGIRVILSRGWEGAILGPSGTGFGPSLVLANFLLPAGPDGQVYEALEGLEPGAVAVVLQEVTAGPLAPGSYPPLQGPIVIDLDDLRRIGPFSESVHSYVSDHFSLFGRRFNFVVGFGSAPSPGLVEDLNDVMATLEVLPAHEPTGYRTERDVDDGLSVTIPSEWTFDEDPTQPIEPENVLAFGSWDFPSGGVCAPFAALDDLPADGAFVWMIEYHGTDHPEDFVPRPGHFDLRDFRFGETSCEATPMYQLRFRDGGRFFQWQVAVGPQASDSLEDDVVLALDSLRVGGVCDTGNDGYAPEIVPASGIVGTEATVSGEFPHGEGGEGGQPVDAETEWVEVWWNLDAGDDAWASALPGGQDPVPARPGPALKLGRVGVSGSCTYELTFTVPDTGPNTYPIVVLHGSPEGAGAFLPIQFEVTG